MFGVVNLGGVQHLIKEGDIISVNHLDLKEEDEFFIKDVISLIDGNNVKFTSTDLASIKIKAKVLGHYKDTKVIIFKKIRRHNHRRKNGFRQSKTNIKILSLAS